MIFRRIYTANYTTIGNELFNDERLQADEIGVMAYLLSRPNDWEVKRMQLMRRFKFGRQTMRRIIVNLIRYGWVRADTTRSRDTGHVHVSYDIYDQPGEEITEAEAKAALSLGSSEALQDAAGDGEDFSTSEDGVSVTGGGEPGAASGGRQGAPGYKKESPIPESPSTEGQTRAPEFSQVLEKWPAEKVLSSVKAERMYVRMAFGLRVACRDGVKPYLDDCKATSRPVCDLTTYIDEQRWVRVLAKPSAAAGAPALFKIRSPQWWRWREYHEAAGHGQRVRYMDTYAERNGNGLWSEPGDWPPPLPKAESTGPPASPLETQDDIAFQQEQFDKAG